MTPLELVAEMDPQPGEAIALVVVHPVSDPMRFLIHPIGAGPLSDLEPGPNADLEAFASEALTENILMARCTWLSEPSVWRLYMVSQEWASSRLPDPHEAAWELLNTVRPLVCTCGTCEQSDVAPLAVAACRGIDMPEA